MTNDERIQIFGAITAQTYLLELLLGNLMRHQQSDQAELAESIRQAIRQQIRTDTSLPPTDHPLVDHEAVQNAAVIHLDEIMDRILTQFYNGQ